MAVARIVMKARVYKSLPALVVRMSMVPQAYKCWRSGWQWLCKNIVPQPTNAGGEDSSGKADNDSQAPTSLPMQGVRMHGQNDEEGQCTPKDDSGQGGVKGQSPKLTNAKARMAGPVW